MSPGLAMFLLATTVLAIAVFRDIGEPWEHGMRGGNAAMYTDGAVGHTLKYGLGTTLGMPAFVIEDGGTLERRVNWHHPPLYWLLMSFAAWLFGHTPMVLRLAHLVLFLPGLFALFAMVRRRVGATAAGATTLAFACTPLIAYFGPMVIQDGAALGLGLATIWSFDAHVAQPTWRSWWRTAALFFLTASIDYSGYWWGPAMFGLALASPPRWPAIRTVMSLFPVALAAFTVMAVHYGLDFGGPVGFLEALLAEWTNTGAVGPIAPERVEVAKQQLLFEFGNAPMLVAAAVGAVSLACTRMPATRGLGGVAVALLVPGVLHTCLMFRHALDHVFWSMHGFAGIAALAAGVALLGMEWTMRGGRWRLAGVALLASCVLVAVHGAAWTHQVIGRLRFVDNGTLALLHKAAPQLGDCTWAMTSAQKVPQIYFGHTQTFCEIDSPEKLQIALALGKSRQLHGWLGFVVAPQHRGTALAAALDAMAEAQPFDDACFYRLRLER